MRTHKFIWTKRLSRIQVLKISRICNHIGSLQLLGLTFLCLYGCAHDSKNDCVDTRILITHEKIFSPDSSAFIIKYSFDHGALGACCNSTSVLRESDSLCKISTFNLPANFENFRWESNDVISAEIQMLSSLQKRTIEESKIEFVNGFKLKKTCFNKIDSDDVRKEIQRLKNASKTYELVAYEYKSRPLLQDSVIHLSVIPKGSKIPRYGNFYIIKDKLYGQIKGIEWVDDVTIKIIINDSPLTYRQIEYYKIDEPYKYASVVKRIKTIINYF